LESEESSQKKTGVGKKLDEGGRKEEMTGVEGRRLKVLFEPIFDYGGITRNCRKRGRYGISLLAWGKKGKAL